MLAVEMETDMSMTLSRRWIRKHAHSVLAEDQIKAFVCFGCVDGPILRVMHHMGVVFCRTGIGVSDVLIRGSQRVQREQGRHVMCELQDVALPMNRSLWVQRGATVIRWFPRMEQWTTQLRSPLWLKPPVDSFARRLMETSLAQYADDFERAAEEHARRLLGVAL